MFSSGYNLTGRLKMQDPTITVLTLTDQVAGVDIDGPGNDEPQIDPLIRKFLLIILH